MTDNSDFIRQFQLTNGEIIRVYDEMNRWEALAAVLEEQAAALETRRAEVNSRLMECQEDLKKLTEMGNGFYADFVHTDFHTDVSNVDTKKKGDNDGKNSYHDAARVL